MSDEPLSKWQKLSTRLKELIKPSGNVSKKKIIRQKVLVAKLNRFSTAIKIVLFVTGYLWMLLLPVPQLGRGTYIDENALQPGQVTTQWNWADVHIADIYLEHIEKLRDSNVTYFERAAWFRDEFAKLGISSSTQSYSFATSNSTITGMNAYAVLASPRHSGSEAMVISASWLSLIDEGKGTINIRGVSTVLALANFLKGYSHWGKDIVFVISDGYLDGMQAFLSAYHESTQSGLHAEPLEFTSGVIWTALNIDYPGHSFSHLGIFYEGLNGRLPNQDLINSVERISRLTVGVPLTVYDHVDARNIHIPHSWNPSITYAPLDFQSYVYEAKNIIRHAKYQANGRGSGVHGLFHQFRIDAITLYCVPAMGPHGFHSLGRIVESTLRTLNNLLERLHASFFFYLYTETLRFMKIGLYLPSALFISVAMMFHGLNTWVDAGWVFETPQTSEAKGEGSPLASTWKRRPRPVYGALGIMAATHLLGVALFRTVSDKLFVTHYKSFSTLVFSIFASIPLIAVHVESTSNGAPLFMALKAVNLCFASTVISIISLLNFSLAVMLSVLIGVPLVHASSSAFITVRVTRYMLYAFLGLGWLLIGKDQMLSSLWNWEVLNVWFAPFMCIVYVPLVLQAGIVCLLPP